jgi:hypothetical protein
MYPSTGTSPKIKGKRVLDLFRNLIEKSSNLKSKNKKKSKTKTWKQKIIW